MTPEVKIRVIPPRHNISEIINFRYKVFILESHFNPSTANHSEESLTDDLDLYSYQLVAENKSGIIYGSVRITFFKDLPKKIYQSNFLFNQLPATVFVNNNFANHSYSSKLASSRQYKGKFPILFESEGFEQCHFLSIGGALCEAVFLFARKNLIEYDWIKCNNHNKKYYQRLGYDMYKNNIDDPEYADDHNWGKTNIMKLELSNPKSKVSPFNKYLI